MRFRDPAWSDFGATSPGLVIRDRCFWCRLESFGVGRSQAEWVDGPTRVGSLLSPALSSSGREGDDNAKVPYFNGGGADLWEHLPFD